MNHDFRGVTQLFHDDTGRSRSYVILDFLQDLQEIRSIMTGPVPSSRGSLSLAAEKRNYDFACLLN